MKTLAALTAGLAIGIVAGALAAEAWDRHTEQAATPEVAVTVAVDTMRRQAPEAAETRVVGPATASLALARGAGGGADNRQALPGGTVSADDRRAMPTGTVGGVDTVEVVVPIEQRVYETGDYKAWVSGYQARLDSIDVYRRTQTVRVRETVKTAAPPKRWHAGVTAGYGYNAGRWSPYIGIGITYSIISF